MKRENIPTPNPLRKVVVKIHNAERYAVAIFGSCNDREVYEKLGFCKALYAELDYITFIVMNGKDYDQIVDNEQRGGLDIYEAINAYN